MTPEFSNWDGSFEIAAIAGVLKRKCLSQPLFSYVLRKD